MSKQCYKCKKPVGFWNTWLFCKRCGFPLELTNALRNCTYDQKKTLSDLLAQDLSVNQMEKQ